MEQEFKPTRIINPGAITVPKTGTVGYVHIEHSYDNRELNPKIFQVDDRDFKTIV